MKPAALFLFCFLAAGPAFGQTRLFPRTGVSVLRSLGDQGTGGGCSNLTSGTWMWFLASTSSTTEVSSPIQPLATSPPCYHHNGSQHLRWITPPVSAAINLTGNYNYQVKCQESAGQLNAGIRFRVLRWRRAVGGIDLTLDVSSTTTECPTSAGTRTIAAHAPTCGSSCNLAVGDRLVLIVEWMASGGSWGGNGSRTATLYIDGVNTFWNFAQTISFASDTNNARPVPSARRLLPRAPSGGAAGASVFAARPRRRPLHASLRRITLG